MGAARIIALMAQDNGWTFSHTDFFGVTVSADGRSFTLGGGGGVRWARAVYGGTQKFYVEVKGVLGFIGFGASKGNSVAPYGAVDTFYWNVQPGGGQVTVNGSVVATYATLADGDTAGMALDPIAGKVWLAKNNAWQAGDPASGTGGISIAAGNYYPHASGTDIINVGIPLPPTYAPPAGFVPL
jgi:hypothetical protein